MVKLGILGYPGSTDISGVAKAAKEAKGIFKEIGPVEIIGCIACEDHPGKKVIDGARLLSKWGADIIAVSTAVGSCRSNRRILEELARQLKSTIIIDCSNGAGV